MSDAGALAAALVGALCATAGILARPKKTPAPENRQRTLLTAVAAAVPVLAWIILIGSPLAAALGFLIATAVVGPLRDAWQKAAAQRPAPQEVAAPEADAAEGPAPGNAEPTPPSVLQLK